jgi:two-component system chemotaxis sensor kinase CheA
VHLQEYLDEAADIIEEIEQVLLAMENQEDQDHLWDCLMRDLHSFKGSAQLMGLDPIVSLAHSMESVITKYRQDKGIVDQTLIDICFECIDAIRKLDNELSISGACYKDITPVLTKMERFSA